ncbi:MAG: hypothetical protein HJJLKODD_00149 [Phycisphaerae bacterium]|nr:hypothetical protein [Phycisphaerae bacterium]
MGVLLMAWTVRLAPWLRLLAGWSENEHLEFHVALQGLVALTIVAVMTWIGRTRSVDLGLGSLRLGRDLFIGLATVIPAYIVNILASLVMVAVILVFGEQNLDSIAKEKIPTIEFVGGLNPVIVLPLMALVGLYEEVLFRGFLMGRFYNLFRRQWLAISVSALLFGLAHAPTQGWMGAG